ncbi:MAG: prenyltransferase/squalene oxidase repeat-containing protein [Actinomycetota bacterium]
MDASLSAVRLWITAAVLERLSGLPSEYIASFPRNKVEDSLAYLERMQIPGSGWSENGSERADAFTTSWTIIALRFHQRPVPHAAIDFLLRCRQADGGFAAHPGTDPADPGNPEITVTALRALNTCDRAGGDFLSSRLRDDLSSTLACKSSRFYTCSEILDWEAGLAPWPVLQLVSQCAVQFDMEGAYEQALLLRILLRMRNQRAWLAAAALRKMQQADGSWPGLALVAPSIESATRTLSAPEKRLLTSATAISALAIHDAQPAHYSTSDAPQLCTRGAE